MYSKLHGGRAKLFPLVKALQKKDLAKTELILGQNLYADGLPKREYDHLLGVLTHRTMTDDVFRDEVASVLETLFGYQRGRDGMMMVHLDLPLISLRNPRFESFESVILGIVRNSLLFHMFLQGLVKDPVEEESTDVVDAHSEAGADEWDVGKWLKNLKTPSPPYT